MSLQNTYTRFLASPRKEALALNPSIHYITTAIAVHGADEIIKQLNREHITLKKRKEKVLSSIETSDSLVVEVETEIEFLTSGANYLPGLDDNFLADHIVRFPMVHIVNFEKGLIKQARLHWDQSNILKQLNVIGRSGRNWPIRDGAEQVRSITDSLSHQTSTSSLGINAPVESTNGIPVKSTATNGTTPSRQDPHTSLHLFNPESTPKEVQVRAPRSNSGAFRPPSRDLESIIGDSDQREVSKPLPPKARSSFSKGQTFELGEHNEQDTAETPKNWEKTKLLDPKKYNHFEFGDGEEAKTEALKPKLQQGKGASSWDFEDFVTPEKKPVKFRKDDVRHFGWSDDDEAAQDSPVKHPKKLVPRKDAQTHFTMRDEDETDGSAPKILANAINRRNDSHFEIADASPVGSIKPHIDQKSGNKSINSQCDITGDDESDSFFGGFGKESSHSGIHIAGNGQGQRKNLGKTWSWDQASPSNAPGTKENIPGKTQGVSRKETSQTEHTSKGFWDF